MPSSLLGLARGCFNEQVLCPAAKLSGLVVLEEGTQQGLGGVKPLR